MFFDVNGYSYRKRCYVDGNGDRYYMDENGTLQTGWFSIKGNNSKGEEYEKHYYAQLDSRVLKGGIHEYSCAMKSHFRKFGNQMSGSGNHLCETSFNE